MASSSSDSDTEDPRIREAAAGVEITRTLPCPVPISTRKTNGDKESRNPKKPSLRKINDGQRDDLELQTTPEFRSHVAKKLSGFLDQFVEVIDEDGRQLKPKDNENNGISDFKLFSTSVPGEEKVVKKPPRKRKPSSSSDSSSEDERIRSVAVTGEYVLAQSRLRSDFSTVDSDKSDTNVKSGTNGDQIPKESVHSIADESLETKQTKPEKLKKHKHKKKKKNKV